MACDLAAPWGPDGMPSHDTTADQRQLLARMLASYLTHTCIQPGAWADKTRLKTLGPAQLDTSKAAEWGLRIGTAATPAEYLVALSPMPTPS